MMSHGGEQSRGFKIPCHKNLSSGGVSTRSATNHLSSGGVSTRSAINHLYSGGVSTRSATNQLS